MPLPQFLVDFNELIEPNLVLLSSSNVKTDMLGNEITFYEGMPVAIYMDDIDEAGEKTKLIASGIAIQNQTNIPWTQNAKWLCLIDEKGIRHEMKSEDEN